MNDFYTSEQQYEHEVKLFEFLNQFGFKKLHISCPSNANIQYISDDYIYDIGCNRYGDAPTCRWINKKKGNFVQPRSALSFFLEDFNERLFFLEEENNGGKNLLDMMKVHAGIIKENPWVFLTSEWVDDTDFFEFQKRQINVESELYELVDQVMNLITIDPSSYNPFIFGEIVAPALKEARKNLVDDLKKNIAQCLERQQKLTLWKAMADEKICQIQISNK